jgi:hypothetical protein
MEANKNYQKAARLIQRAWIARTLEYAVVTTTQTHEQTTYLMDDEGQVVDIETKDTVEETVLFVLRDKEDKVVKDVLGKWPLN